MDEKKLICSRCDNEITEWSKSGLCHSCAMIERFKDPLEIEKLKPKVVTSSLTKDILYTLYWTNKKTLLEIAKIFNISISSIIRYMNKFDIERRKPKEKIIKRCSKCDEQVADSNTFGLCMSCSHIGNLGYWTGKKRSQETIEKIRKTKIGCVGHWRNKKRPNVSGDNHWTTRQDFLPEHIEKLSLSHQGQTLDSHKPDCQCSFCKDHHGANNPFYGHKHTDEYKKQASLLRGGTGTPYSKSDYGLEFNETLKKIIRERDNYKCQVCGCPKNENGSALDIHHIDYNKLNNILKNLIALCDTCHMKTNFNREYWKKYLEELISCL